MSERYSLVEFGPPVPPRTLNDYADECHIANAKWWQREDGTRIERCEGTTLRVRP